MELEDGELSSSSSTEELTSIIAKDQQPPSTSSSFKSFSHGNEFEGYSELPRPTAQRPNENLIADSKGNQMDDSDEESKESSGDSSDSDYFSTSKKKMRNQKKKFKDDEKCSWRNPNSKEFRNSFVDNFNGSFENPSNAFAFNAYSFQKKRVNTVWSDVLQEDIATEIVQNIHMDRSSLVDRGPESFSVNKRKRVHTNDEEDSKSRKPQEEQMNSKSHSESTSDPEDSDGISSDGLSDTALEYIRTRLDKINEDKEEKLKTLLSQFTGLEDSEIVNHISTQLEEEKPRLIEKAIEHLGRTEALRVFVKTLAIQQRGGIMTKDCSRKRSGGGIYFYLLQRMRSLPREAIEKVFEEDRLQRIQEKRKYLGFD